MTKEREALIKQLREGQTYDFSTGDLLDMSSIMDDAANMLEALAQPEQEPNGYVQTVIEALYENGDPVSVDAAELLQRITAQPEQEPLEYWNAVEGWVKIDEVRQHFETVNCGTIYKNAGEGRVPVYTTPPKREWVGLTDGKIDAVTNVQWGGVSGQPLAAHRAYARAIEAKLKELNA